MHFHIITLFPEALQCYFDASVLGKAQERDAVRISFYNPRDYTNDKHRTTDERPYGGGPGMVMMAEPILRAARDAIGRKKNVKILVTSARGEQFDATRARTLADECKHIVIIAGHYEGIDARVMKALAAEEVTIGPYVLTGGEVPALVMVDAIARFVPGVLGNEASIEEERTASAEVYTRPESIRWKGERHDVPDVLLSGDHAAIEAWRRERE